MLCLVRSGKQQLTGLASNCNYRRPETSVLNWARQVEADRRHRWTMDNSLPVNVDLCHCMRRFQTRPNPVRTPDTTLSAVDRQIGNVCDSRATNAAFPNRAVGGADRHVSVTKHWHCAGEPQVRLEKSRTMEASIPCPGQPRHRDTQDAGLNAETLFGLPEMNWENFGTQDR